MFTPHTISKFSLLLNSTSIPAKPISVKKKVEDNVRCYRHFLENTGFADTNTSNGIEPFSFLNHDFCISFDLTGDLCLGAHNHRPESGTLDLSLEFEQTLQQPITLLVIASYESCLKLDAQEVSLNYSL